MAIGSKSWAIKGTAVLAIATDNHPLTAERSIPKINLTAPSTTTSPTIPHYLIFAILAVVVVFVIAIAFLLLYRKHRKTGISMRIN